jgi:ribosomal protein S18 acetylase RimI-like enzyme
VLTIRPATPADAIHMTCFVDMASEGLALMLWDALRAPHQTLVEFGRARAMREDGAFSYRNAHIAEVDGLVAGGLVGYRIEPGHDVSVRMPDPAEVAKVPEFLRPVVELEQLAADHWYVNILATYPELRGRGVGAALLAHADALGRAAGATGTALIVDAENQPALSAYKRAGYSESARRPLVPFPMRPNGGVWLLLTKPLP